MNKLGLDPSNPNSDEIVDQIKTQEESQESEDEDEEGENSDVEVTSDMDIFDIIKLAQDKEAK